MDSKVKACKECTRLCWLVHREEKNSSPAVSSFFKVMIGEDISEVLVCENLEFSLFLFEPLFILVHVLSH